MGNLSSFTNSTVAPQIVATGTLAAGQTDFGTSLAFPVNQYPTQQVGAVLVYLDGQLLLRNVGNATAAPTADGNYQEVDAGNGFSILIRLNQADPLNARTYTIVSNGFTVAQPTSVYQSQIQTLQTQQDVMASTLADVAGVSTTAFYAVPNDTTRLTFTNRVTALESNSASKNASNTWTVAQNMLGKTDGAAIASGYIGQQIVASFTTQGNGSTNLTTGTNYNLGSFALTPGVWLITGNPAAGFFENHANAINAGIYIAYIGISLTQTTGFSPYQSAVTFPSWGNATNSYLGSIPVLATINISSSTTYYINGVVAAYGTTSNSWVRFDLNPSDSVTFVATRIA